ncbi:hypothetical protein KI387_020721, partial [Taxus chinensis]
MGKIKKAQKAAPKKKQEKLGTVFGCPFCNHDNSVECKMSNNLIAETGKILLGKLNVRYVRRVSAPLKIVCAATWVTNSDLLIS